MIKLIVGLGNPGKEHLAHRHNVGFWFVDQLAKKLSLEFGSQSKFFGETAETLVGTKKGSSFKAPNIYELFWQVNSSFGGLFWY